MADEMRKLELRSVLQADGAEIVAARTKALLIHKSGDIDAAGDEVERAFRTVLRRKLPTAYYVGTGHIVDREWNTSPQLDAIIADNSGFPVLFQTENGTEYFPFESVYAIGEVKSAYYKNKSPIHRFVEVLRAVRSGLKRPQTPVNYLAPGITVGDGLLVSDKRPYKNPLFSFMIFVHSNGFSIADIVDAYTSMPASELPNLLCFLDLGVVINVRVPSQSPSVGGSLPVNLNPEFNTVEPGLKNCWTFKSVGEPDFLLGGNFGFLFFALAEHLKNCVLTPLDLLAYFQSVFRSEGRVQLPLFGKE